MTVGKTLEIVDERHLRVWNVVTGLPRRSGIGLPCHLGDFCKWTGEAAPQDLMAGQRLLGRTRPLTGTPC